MPRKQTKMAIGKEREKRNQAGRGRLRSNLSAIALWVNEVLDGFNLVLFVLLIILATMQVLFRYVLMYPLPWTEELARFTLVWVTFLGAASVTRRKLHLAVDYFVAKLPPSQRRAISLFFYILVITFLATILWGAVVMMGETTPVFAGSIPWLSIMYLYLGPVIGIFLMLIYVSIQFAQAIRESRALPSGSRSAVQPKAGAEKC